MLVYSEEGGSYTKVLSILVLFLISPFLFKLGAFPFSVWVPDVYEGIPVSIAFIFMVVTKSTFILTFIRVLYLILGNFFI
jgi:NADH-quinone oxidoreductase subunit N